MVQKNVLQKLTNPELESYLREGSRFTPEAIHMAAEILEERGRIFTDEEKFRIRELIRNKKEAEVLKKLEQEELQKDHIADDPNAIRLYPRELVILSGLFFGFISGAVLLALNLFKLKKYKQGTAIILIGIVYSVIQYSGIRLLHETADGETTTRYWWRPELQFAIMGFAVFFSSGSKPSKRFRTARHHRWFRSL
ncbi:hypothetical protein [uncultured Chryseobacterium sp.]|uniref:hypothetical protein n=1 Tax=uncultured Chryseobacterium sp. TaxID=259322 RepID=UPI0025E56AC9|nr:hypothetical protein [uncultured Chryseobacterium sp.]